MFNDLIYMDEKKFKIFQKYPTHRLWENEKKKKEKISLIQSHIYKLTVNKIELYSYFTNKKKHNYHYWYCQIAYNSSYSVSNIKKFFFFEIILLSDLWIGQSIHWIQKTVMNTYWEIKKEREKEKKKHESKIIQIQSQIHYDQNIQNINGGIIWIP